MISKIFPVLFLLIGAAFGNESCPSSHLAFPEQFAAEDEERAAPAPEPVNTRFPFLEAGLQVFLHMKIPCDGQIFEYRFWSAKPIVNGLHLGVFRINLTDNSAQLVSNSHVNEVNGAAETWVTWRPPASIEVRYGDVLGLFYDELGATGDISVRSLTLPFEEDDSFETLVYLTSAKQLVDEAKGRISLSEGFYVKRVPALYVILEGSGFGSSAFAYKGPESSDMQSLCNVRPTLHHLGNLVCEVDISVRYYYHSTTRFCREFIHCSINNQPSFAGFASYKECMSTCRKPIGHHIVS